MNHKNNDVSNDDDEWSIPIIITTNDYVITIIFIQNDFNPIKYRKDLRRSFRWITKFIMLDNFLIILWVLEENHQKVTRIIMIIRL